MNQYRTKRKGISPVLATIILLAVTVAVGVGVASYVFGLFGTYSESAAIKVQGAPTLKVLTPNGGNLTITLANAGAQSDSVSTITTTVNGQQISGSLYPVTPTTVNGGGGTLSFNATFAGATFAAGTSYQVKISFNSGSLLAVTTTAS
ncbi:MAG: hypothetical protein HYY22_02260 [Thaumarchaeota archaeon]|nr:hypothetical protein [Nitrososphaerota archaeon]